MGRGTRTPAAARRYSVDLGALPCGFLLFSAERGAFGHGTRLPADADLTVLGVVHRLAEAALVGFLVDLGRARLAATAHDVDIGFLAALELARNAIDQTFVDQALQAGGGFHGLRRQARKAR